MVSPASTVKRNPMQVYSKVDHEIVMLGLDEGKYYALNEVGARVWEHLDHPTLVKELIHKLLGEFDVSVEKCEIETLELLNELYDNKLIVIEPDND